MKRGGNVSDTPTVRQGRHQSWSPSRSARALAMATGVAVVVGAAWLASRLSQADEFTWQNLEEPGRQPSAVVRWAQVKTETTAGPARLYMVQIPWPRAGLSFVTSLASQSVVGLERVSRQVLKVDPRQGQPLVAVNGDFFVILPGPYQGDPAGIHLRDGELVSDPAGGPAVWFLPDGTPRLGNVRSALAVRWPGGQTTPLGLNEERRPNAAVLFTPTFGPSTRTTNGTELVVKTGRGSSGLPLRPGQTLRGRVETTHPTGDAPVPAGRVVVSLGPQAKWPAPTVKRGTRLEITGDTAPPLRGIETALGGGPILVSDGQIPIFGPPQPRHPRTAIGWNATNLFLIVVDGRQPGWSVGMTLPELATWMHQRGCHEALNLDGGGSSTLWIAGQVVNRPSDGWERAVANALVLVKRVKDRRKP